MPGGSVLAHGAVLGIWLACAGAMMGVGWLVLTHVFGLPSVGRDRGFAAVWTGLAAVVLFLQVWHFVFPVNGWALAVVTLMGIIGLSTAAPRPQLPIRAPDFATPLRFLVFAGLAVWLANRCLAPFIAYDSEMYMIPALEWTRAFPVVPGLGALHGRLAFNSSTVLLASVLDAGPWSSASPHLLNGFFLFLLAARIASRFPAVTTVRREAVATGAFDLLLLAPLVAVALDDQRLPSLSADVGVAVALFAGASLLLGRLAAEDPSRSAPDSLIAAAAAFAVAVTLKLSAAVFAFFGCGVVFALLFADVRAGVIRRRSAVSAAAFCILISGTWTARGIGASGYPFYPATVLAAPVDWRVPLEQADAEAAWVSHFARTWYSTPLANADSVAAYQWRRFHWLRPWARAVGEGRDRGLVSVPFACALVFGLGLLAWKREAQKRRGPGWLALPAAAGLLFWFAAAPRPSMGFAAAWVLAALSVAVFVGRLQAKAGQRLAVLVGALLPLVVVGNAVRLDYPEERWTLDAWRWTLARDADPSDWFPEPATPELLQYRTRSGLTLNVPVERNLCERAPLPCTPHPAANLRLRQEGSLSGGFLIEGDWQPERWPNSSSRFLGSWRASRE